MVAWESERGPAFAELEPRLPSAVSAVRQKFPAEFLRLGTFFLGARAANYNNHNIANMPKSKRAKVVHLTKTDKKGKELSQKLFANVQDAADNFQHIFVFSVENMRNSYLKQVRAEFSDSRYVTAYAICIPFF
jgi:hypothetical protein